MQFETTRPEIAELLYRLKYKSDQEAAAPIIETASEWLKPHRHKIDVLVPVPPSTQRAFQPVLVLAKGIGQALDLPVKNCASLTRREPAIKEIDALEDRRRRMEGLYTVDENALKGLDVLLFDDLFRSGATLETITELLLTEAAASSVRVLTVTKTRSRR